MFHGSMVALVTPMTAVGDIDYAALEALIEWHIASGTAALVIAGTTGEAATLDDNEKVALMRFVVKHAAERIPVIVGTAANATAHAVALTRQAMQAGADACLIMTPAYVKPTQEGLYQHYHAIAQISALPIILYNVPSRTACDLLPETLERLSAISNIIGVKEATADVARAEAIKARCGDAMDIYSGDDASSKALMSVGAKGVISVTANVDPSRMSQFCQAMLQGDSVLATQLDEQLAALHSELFAESNPIPVKWALEQMGRITGGIRLPLTRFSSEYHESLRAVLKQLQLIE